MNLIGGEEGFCCTPLRPFGIGDLGPSASRFIDFLEQAGMSYWQMLPLVPVMDEFSPYQSTSAMAGNPLLISPELLAEEGLIGQERLDGVPEFPEERVDLSIVLSWKQDLLKAAWRSFCLLYTSPSPRDA